MTKQEHSRQVKRLRNGHFLRNGAAKDLATMMVTSGAKGHNFRSPNHLGAPKGANSVASNFFNAVPLLPKDLRFENGEAKLVSCPGRYITSVRPCLRPPGLTASLCFSSVHGSDQHWYRREKL